MANQIRLALESRDPPTFRLWSHEGGPALAAHFAVAEADSIRPIWWLVASAWARATSFMPMWAEVSAEEPVSAVPEAPDPIEDLPQSDPRQQAALAGAVDPIEDLPPSDPRHRAAVRRLGVDELALRRPLEIVTYGSAPSGFHAVFPLEAPPVLQSGKTYVAIVNGLVDEARITFVV